MNQKSINSNKQFMVGNGILAFGVFFIVCLFLYLGFRGQRKENGTQQAFKDIYTLQITGSFSHDSLAIYINDSLLIDRTMTESGVKLQVNRFAEESMLMVVNHKDDKITPFNLSPEGSLIRIEKKNGKIYIEETEAPKEGKK